jgi:hypothetical protein
MRSMESRSPGDLLAHRKMHFVVSAPPRVAGVKDHVGEIGAAVIDAVEP